MYVLCRERRVKHFIYFRDCFDQKSAVFSMKNLSNKMFVTNYRDILWYLNQRMNLDIFKNYIFLRQFFVVNQLRKWFFEFIRCSNIYLIKINPILWYLLRWGHEWRNKPRLAYFIDVSNTTHVSSLFSEIVFLKYCKQKMQDQFPQKRQKSLKRRY